MAVVLGGLALVAFAVLVLLGSAWAAGRGDLVRDWRLADRYHSVARIGWAAGALAFLAGAALLGRAW